MTDERDETKKPTQPPREARRPAMRTLALISGLVGGLAGVGALDALPFPSAPRRRAPMPRPDPEPRVSGWDRAAPGVVDETVALEPRSLTRDELAAQEKRERRAEKARHDEERRVVGQNVAMEGMAKR